MTQKISRITALGLAFMLSNSCAHARGSAPVMTPPLALGCDSFEDEFFDPLYKFLQGDRGARTLPSVLEMRESYEAQLKEARYSSLTSAEKTRALQLLVDLYQLVAVEGVNRFADVPADPNFVLEAIASFDMGDRSSKPRAELMTKIEAKFAEIRELTRSSATNCAQASEAEDLAESGLLGEWKRSKARPVYGALKTMAVAYQSCSAGKRAPLTSATEDVDGIKIIGTHSDGVGSLRVVGDLGAFLKSHPYIGSSPSSACFNVRSHPLIYDYGGKPATGSGAFDYFKEAGTGTSVLGTDCSGFMYTAFAGAGLKLKKSGRLKAEGVHGTRAVMWMDPQTNGLTCFDHVRFDKSSNLKSGDVLASTGHVVMVDTVGSDPFGIRNLKDESDCKKENMSLTRLDFTILQSAPVKNGIGIDRIRAVDYFTPGTSMGEALIEHAVNACLAKTKRKTITTRAERAGLVRHLGTSSCRDTAVRFVNEGCLNSCR